MGRVRPPPCGPLLRSKAEDEERWSEVGAPSGQALACTERVGVSTQPGHLTFIENTVSGKILFESQTPSATQPTCNLPSKSQDRNRIPESQILSRWFERKPTQAIFKQQKIILCVRFQDIREHYLFPNTASTFGCLAMTSSV